MEKRDILKAALDINSEIHLLNLTKDEFDELMLLIGQFTEIRTGYLDTVSSSVL